MDPSAILPGTIHILPEGMLAALADNPEICHKWNKLTPLARNERICRITSAKKQSTRENRLLRWCQDVCKGKKRPCCRPGCPHHNENTQKRFK